MFDKTTISLLNNVQRPYISSRVYICAYALYTHCYMYVHQTVRAYTLYNDIISR